MGKSKLQKKIGKEDTKENADSQNRKKKSCTDSGRRFQMLDTEKRKITSSNTWSLKNMDMGCVKLGSDNDSNSDTSSDIDTLELTPAVTVNLNTRSAPMAPRVLVSSQKDNILNTSTDSYDICVLDSSPITRKQIYSDHKNSTDVHCNHFLELSDEIILLIFRWLPKFTLTKCARVCHRWHRLVNDESLWKRLDLSNKTLSAGSIGNVLNKGVQILRLAKSEMETPIFTGISENKGIPRLSKLQVLDLSMSTTKADALEQIFFVCKELKKLSLEHCQLTDKSCQHIGENPNLEVLNLCMCQGITNAGIMSIIMNCAKLESLNLGWTGLHRQTVVYLSLCLPPNLSKLNISGCRENITDEEVLQLCRNCSSLKELDLSDSTVLTCTSVGHIVDNLHSLEYLALSRCYRIFPNTMLKLKEIPSLLAVDIFGILQEDAFKRLKEELRFIKVNKFPFSSISRPTTGIHRTSLWGLRVRDIM